MELYGTGVSCTTVHPGFVQSEIARVDRDGRFDSSLSDPRPKALMWSTPRAARVMLKAIASRKRDFVFTGHGKIGAFLALHFPGLLHWVMARSAAKMVALQPGSSPPAK